MLQRFTGSKYKNLNRILYKNLRPYAVKILIGLFIIIVLRRIFINIHIDEENMVAMGYRATVGDAYFTEIQEPQLLIAPIIGLIETLWIAIIGGTAGIFVFMKAITILITLFVAIYVFITIKRRLGTRSALFCALFYGLFHFRYINVIDYTFLFDTASLLCIFIWLNYETAKHKYINLILATLMFCVGVLCFPSSVILYPIFLLLYYEKCGWRGVRLILFVCFCALWMETAVIFRDIWNDGITEHIASLISGSTYGKKALHFEKIILKILLCVMLLISCINQRTVFEICRNRIAKIFILNKWGGGIIFAIFCYGLSSLTIHTVVKLEYFSKNGYFFILLAGAILSIFYEKRYWLQTMFWWGVLGDILVSIMTHYDTQWCYALPAFIATGVMLFDSSLLKKEYLKRTSIALLLFFEVFAKDIIQITNTDHYGGTVFNQEYCYIRHGPAKWVWARSVDAEKYNEIYSWIRKNISRETKVCYFGKNVLLYLMSEHIDIAVPQLFMDYADDTILGQYYNTYPEQMPDLVIYDISPTSKVIASENEKNIFHSYNKIYSSCNYEIYIR